MVVFFWFLDVELEEEAEEEDKPKTKKVDKTTWDWEVGTHEWKQAHLDEKVCSVK